MSEGCRASNDALVEFIHESSERACVVLGVFWAIRTVEVLWTATEANGAIAERYWELFGVERAGGSYIPAAVDRSFSFSSSPPMKFAFQIHAVDTSSDVPALSVSS